MIRVSLVTRKAVGYAIRRYAVEAVKPAASTVPPVAGSGESGRLQAKSAAPIPNDKHIDAKVSPIVDSISSLTLLETARLVAMLKVRLGACGVMARLKQLVFLALCEACNPTQMTFLTFIHFSPFLGTFEYT